MYVSDTQIMMNIISLYQQSANPTLPDNIPSTSTKTSWERAGSDRSIGSLNWAPAWSTLTNGTAVHLTLHFLCPTVRPLYRWTAAWWILQVERCNRCAAMVSWEGVQGRIPLSCCFCMTPWFDPCGHWKRVVLGCARYGQSLNQTNKQEETRKSQIS